MALVIACYSFPNLILHFTHLNELPTTLHTICAASSSPNNVALELAEHLPVLALEFTTTERLFVGVPELENSLSTNKFAGWQ